MKPVRNVKMSVSDYIQYEIDTKMKYEYHDGEIFALAGGSIEHALLVGNIYAEIRNSLRLNQSDCKPITSEAKLYIKKEKGKK